MTASTLSAVIALLLVRALGWQLSTLVSHPRLDALDTRLSTRGWPAVLSLRLIPAVPFSVLNYAVGASSVGVVPYFLATLVGLLPGTAAVVILGDAMTGDISPALVLVSLCTGTIGIAGLVYEARRHQVSRHPEGEAENPADEVGLVDTAALTQIGHRLADAIEFILHLWVGGQVCDGLPGDLGLGQTLKAAEERVDLRVGDQVSGHSGGDIALHRGDVRGQATRDSVGGGRPRADDQNGSCAEDCGRCAAGYEDCG